MTGKWEDLEESHHGLIDILFRNLSEETEEKYEYYESQ
jgi:hypothetical protein